MIKYNFWNDEPANAAVLGQKLYPQLVQETIRLADEACENSFTFRGHWEMERTHVPVVFGNKINWQNVENDDPEWTYAFNRHSFLVALGQAWQYTQNAKYPAAAARLWDSWLENEPFAEDKKNTTWRSIETGLRCENWLRALALFNGSGMPNTALMEKIEESLRVHAGWLLQANGNFQQLSNWGVLQDHGLFLLGAAFNNKDWQATAVQRLCTQLNHQVFADGTHWEQSPMYHCEVLHCCLDTMLAAKNCGYALPNNFTNPVLAMSRALAALLRPDGLLLCQGDSDEIDARDLLALAAFLFKDPALKQAAGGVLHPENIWDFADAALEYENIQEPDKKEIYSTALPDSGNYMLQSGAGQNAGFLHFYCGVLGSGHGHSSLLHVDLVHAGESILCDSGRYTYVNTPMRRQLKGMAAHNCVLVDGVDPSPPKDSWAFGTIAEPLKGAYRFTKTVDYVSGAHLGYMQKGVLHRRHILRLPQNLWLLWDVFYAADERPHIYSHYYHFGPAGKVLVNGNMLDYSGEKCCAKLAFISTADENMQMSRQPLSREYNKLEEGDCLKMKASAAGFYSVATVIAAGDAGQKNNLTVKAAPVTMADAGTTVPPEKAQAVVINLNGEEYTVIICHNEVISLVDMLCANGHKGYGKVLAFLPKTKEGLCLAW